MSEPIVFVGIGMLIALTLTFSARLFIRSRFGRVALKRLESAAPGLMAGIEADMAQLHGQIAVATRRLELSVEQMKSKTSTQLTEISRTTEAIARLKAEHSERTVSLGTLEARERKAAEQLRDVEAQLKVRTAALDEVHSRLTAEKAELKELMKFIGARDKVAEADRSHAAAMEAVMLEKAHAETQLAEARRECARLEQDMQAMKKQVETTWASERMANSLLRERINDVASEVVRVAHALEGLSSPIDTLMAGKAAELDAALGHPAAANESIPASDDSKSLLAHRIRSLQKRTARVVAASGGP
jgi:chromosome segregation ATPase